LDTVLRMGSGKNKKKAFGEADFSTWIPARDAHEAVVFVVKDYAVAKEKLLSRLVAGLIEARAEYMYSQSDYGEKQLNPNKYILLKSGVWREVLEHPQTYARFWESSDLVLELEGSNSIERLLDVRFNRAQMAKLAPQFAQPHPHTAGLPAGKSEPAPEKRPVAKADLARWAEIFVKVHPDFGEPFALQSARAMFPDKSVGRDRMRDAITAAIGPRKRGPKAAK
jgi:hypothetical protein